jgi:hypothetical protein
VYDGWDLLRVSVLILVSSIPLALSVWALLDAARRPGWAWALAERRQVVWMLVILFATCTIIGGIVVSVWYLAVIRPHIAAAEEGRID